MIESKPSTIEAPPSVDDITATDERVGTVDFSTQLGAPAEPARADDTAGGLASMARMQRPADSDDADGPSLPFILPPARVDAVMAAEAERTRLEIAAARGELPDDEDELDPDDDESDDDSDDDAEDTSEESEADGDDAPSATSATSVKAAKAKSAPVADAAAPALAPATTKKRKTKLGRKAEVAPEAEEVEEVEPTPVKPSGPPEGLLIHDVADLDLVAEEAAAHEEVRLAEEARVREIEEARRRVAEELQAAEAAEAAASGTDPDGRDLSPAELLAAPGAGGAAGDGQQFELLAPDAPAVLSVEQVADEVIAAMRAVNEAHELHVESLELETARRCELLTAQAELDAELIRLHARREAHAIIAAARSRSGAGDPTLVEPDQLGEIGETFSRFAETIETTVAPGPGSPDHLRKS